MNQCRIIPSTIDVPNLSQYGCADSLSLFLILRLQQNDMNTHLIVKII